MNTLLLGKWGEAKAAEYLRKNKYTVIGANFRTRAGEIDLVAENKKFVVFVEVKLRKNADFGRASEFVNGQKRCKIITTAKIWLSRYPTEKVVRFDVIEIYAPDGMTDNFTLNHIENAFCGSEF